MIELETNEQIQFWVISNRSKLLEIWDELHETII